MNKLNLISKNYWKVFQIFLSFKEIYYFCTSVISKSLIFSYFWLDFIISISNFSVIFLKC